MIWLPTEITIRSIISERRQKTEASSQKPEARSQNKASRPEARHILTSGLCLLDSFLKTPAPAKMELEHVDALDHLLPAAEQQLILAAFESEEARRVRA